MGNLSSQWIQPAHLHAKGNITLHPTLVHILQIESLSMLHSHVEQVKSKYIEWLATELSWQSVGLNAMQLPGSSFGALHELKSAALRVTTDHQACTCNQADADHQKC